MLTDIDAYLMVLKEQKQGYMPYIKQKMDEEDWHGAIDGLMDVRDIEAKIQVLRQLKDSDK